MTDNLRLRNAIDDVLDGFIIECGNQATHNLAVDRLMDAVTQAIDTNALIHKLVRRFPKHHVQIDSFPTGGMLHLWSCEECGSEKYYSEAWAYDRGYVRSLEQAIASVDKQLERDNAQIQEVDREA